jgi:hypothetical protein
MPQRLAQHLMAQGLVSAQAVDEAMRRAEKAGVGLDTALLLQGALSEAAALQAVSDVSGIRLVNLSDFEPNLEAAALMPYKMSRQVNVVPLSLDGQTLHVACAYPVPMAQLRDIGFLLGRKLELWVALEARVRDWQSVVYRQPLDATTEQALARLDPSRPPPQRSPEDDDNPLIGGDAPALGAPGSDAVPTDPLATPQRPAPSSLSSTSGARQATPTPAAARPAEERPPSPAAEMPPGAGRGPEARPTARGTGDEEPLLLTQPRKRKRLDVVEPPVVTAAPAAAPLGAVEERGTTVFDATAYERFARGSDDTGAPAPLDEHESTRVVDLRGYENFARHLTQLGATPMVFPGGVLPPRPSAAAAPPAMPPASTPGAQPAAPRRGPPQGAGAPLAPSRRPAAPSQAPEARPTPPEPTPLGATAVAAPRDETDFSDVADAPAPPRPPTSPGPVPRRPSPSFTGATTGPTPAARPPAPRPAASPTSAPSPGERRGATPAGGVTPRVTSSPTAAPTAGSRADERRPVNAPSAAPAWPSPAAAAAATEPVYPAPPGLAPSAAAEWTLAQARASLKASSHDREALLAVVLEYGRRAFDFVAAFAVQRGAAGGWDARGEGDVSLVRNVSVPLDAASVFRTVALTRGSYVGPLPPDALTQHYLALLGRAPRTVFVWPVEVQSRLVAIVYGDCGTRPVSQRRLSDFILFCQELPAAFHELILSRKRGLGARAEAQQGPPPTPSQGLEPDGHGRGDDGDWLQGLVTLLTGPDPAERDTAMHELAKTPEASAAVLARAFPGPSGWSRLPVVELPEPAELGPIPNALARLGHAGALALAPLLDASDSDTRYLALLTAGSLRYPEVIDGVLRGLFDLEPDISSAARVAATSLRLLPSFAGRMDELRRELAATDPLRRSLAARALGVLHDREAIDGLINLTGTEDGLVATAAADALKEITRFDFGPSPRAWTAWYARARSQRRLDWLLEALASEHFESRLSAIEELERAFGDNHGYFADGPPSERRAALAHWRAVVASRPDFDV